MIVNGENVRALVTSGTILPQEEVGSSGVSVDSHLSLSGLQVCFTMLL